MGGRRSISGGLRTLSHQAIDNANASALLNGIGCEYLAILTVHSLEL